MKTNRNILTYMAFGDTLGFLLENSEKRSDENFRPFNYPFNNNIKLQAETGQWSYITQLMMINCKCLVDNKEKRKVFIDYKRLIKELKLWKDYRYGSPLNYIRRLKLGNKYYSDDFYWNDKRGESFSRIIPIAVTNKNFSSAQEETYKNIIYINRHPQVILTGLLLLRTVYFLINNKKFERIELIEELKNYLINLQLLELEENIKGKLPSNYKIKFEQEKINYLIELDRIKNLDAYRFDIPHSKGVFLSSIINFFNIYNGKIDLSKPLDCSEKEVYVIVYGLLALSMDMKEVEVTGIKDVSFIKNMDEYLIKLREYEIGKTTFTQDYNNIDLFSLDKGSVLRHPLLNNIRIKEKRRFDKYTELIIVSKSGEYKFVKAEYKEN